MKKFSEYIICEKEMSIEEFIDSVENNFYKHFPNGFIVLKYRTQIKPHIRGTFGMIGDVKDQVNKIVQNDKMYHSFVMFLKDVDAGIWSFEASQSSIHVKPAEGSYNVMDSIKTKMGNNSKITLEKADKKLEKFFKKLSGMMKENIDNIAGVEEIDKKYLIFK